MISCSVVAVVRVEDLAEVSFPEADPLETFNICVPWRDEHAMESQDVLWRYTLTRSCSQSNRKMPTNESLWGRV